MDILQPRTHLIHDLSLQSGNISSKIFIRIFGEFLEPQETSSWRSKSRDFAVEIWALGREGWARGRENLHRLIDSQLHVDETHILSRHILFCHRFLYFRLFNRALSGGRKYKKLTTFELHSMLLKLFNSSFLTALPYLLRDHF
jgi:hypothetical protein